MRSRRPYREVIADWGMINYILPIMSNTGALLSTLTVLLVHDSNRKLQELVYYLLRCSGYTDEEIHDLCSDYSKYVPLDESFVNTVDSFVDRSLQ